MRWKESAGIAASIPQRRSLERAPQASPGEAFAPPEYRMMVYLWESRPMERWREEPRGQQATIPPANGGLDTH